MQNVIPAKTGLWARLFFPLMFILPPLFWAGNFIVGRLVRNEIPPVTLTMIRWLIALCCILPFAYRYMQNDYKKYIAILPRIIALSLSGLAAFSLLVYFGLHHTSGTNALLLNSCIPALIMLFAALFYGQPLKKRQIAGVMISFIGVLTIVFHGNVSEFAALTFSSGDLLLLGAMVSFAFYTLWLRKVPADINRLGLIGVQVIVTLIFVLPLWLVELIVFSPLTVFNQTTTLAVLFLGIFPSFLAYLIFGKCVAHFGAEKAGLSIHLIPLFGVILSVLFLGEKIHFYHVAGIAGIAGGIYIASKKKH